MLSGVSRRTSREALVLQALHLAKMLGPMRMSSEVYRHLPIASLGQLTVR